MPKAKSVRPRKGWVVVHGKKAGAIIWNTKRQAKIWGVGEPDAYVARATLTLDPPKTKRRKA